MKATLATSLAACALAASANAQTISKFPTTQLTVGMYVINAEVAKNPDQRAQGLMFRQRMGSNEGMIFIFDEPAYVCMWMKNTLIPLSVAFLGNDGKIANIEDMTPQTLDSHCGKKDIPIRYALEMNQGWFKQKHIVPGMKVEGLPR